MVHCGKESIFSLPSLFWKTKTKSGIQIDITFLIIDIFDAVFSILLFYILVVSFQFISKTFSHDL